MTFDVHARELRYFVAVAEELHVTRAAQRLFVSQPALSKQLRALERRLGAPLFDRDSRGVAALTAAGAALLEPARRVLAELEVALSAVEQAKSTQQATLVVGMSTSLGRARLLPAVRSRFAAAHPEATLVLRQLGWDDSTCGLADRDTDVAFLWLPLPDPERFGWLEVAEEPRLVALPEGHRLAGRVCVPFSELLDEPFLALPAAAGAARDYWLATDARAGRPARIGAEINTPDETYEALVDGRGVCLLATGNAALLTRSGVVTRPVEGISHSRLVLAWRRGDTRPLVRSYVEACAATVAKPVS